MNPGKRRQFLVVGAVAPNLSDTPANLGTLSTAVGNEVIFTAGSTIQNGTVNAEKSGLTGTAAVQVTNADLTAQVGLISETIPGPLGNGASLFPYAGSPASTITLANVSTLNDFREGTFSVRSNLNVAADDFVGWAIEVDAGTTDLNEYFDGSIRFWFRANSALLNKVAVTVRSPNVIAGNEHKLWLHNFGVTYNNTWQAVTIPIDQLAGFEPKTDLSQVKVLFNIAVASPTTGGQFFIDNLRWDTRKPGPISRIQVFPGPSLTIPKGLKRSFTAVGYDIANVPVDVWPSWALSGGMGSIAPNQGPRVLYTAATAANTGTLTASVGSIFYVTNITIQDIDFTQSVNVYTDAGAGGPIRIFPFPPTAEGSINLSSPEHRPGDAPEGFKVMRATISVSATGFAGWFVTEQDGTRFLKNYEGGYLNFHVRTTRDLEIAIRSDNIPAGENNAKVRLSQLGIPTDGTWQEVWLALDQFAQLDPRLDFANMKDLFVVAAVGAFGGPAVNQVFDIDGVKWFTADPHVPDLGKVYQGIKDKQNLATGLVVTYSNDITNRAVTYDQALAAMAFTFHGDTTRAAQVLNVYRTKYNNGAGFAGFHEEYDRDNVNTIRDFDRTVGPNAWIMLAALHYKSATGLTTYDAMITGIANWMLTQQAADGAFHLGFMGNPGTQVNSKSTEHNFDVYAALKAYRMITGLATYETAANRCLTWLTTSHLAGGAWNVAQGRFNVGELATGAANTDFALDAYSWAPLALSSYTAVLNNAEAVFGTTKTNDVNGFEITGFDFSSYPGENVPPFGKPVDKDAVWIEGTAHMVLSYLAAGNQAKATQYLNELDKAVYTVSPTAQALNYASNAGTAYWYPSLMDSTHASLSSMCWYLFANRGFNPLQPVPLFGVTVKNISNNLPAATVGWSVNVPNRWARANQYIEFRAQPVDQRPWGVAIYTDNKNPAITPRFQDPTPGLTFNFDSNPAGLLEILPTATTTHYRLDMGWKIQDSTSPVPAAIQPFSTLDGTGSFEWFFMKDKGSPAIDVNGDGDTNDSVDRAAFTPGEPYIRPKSNQGIQTVSGQFFPSIGADYIYLEADFTTAAAQVLYRANVILEYFIQ